MHPLTLRAFFWAILFAIGTAQAQVPNFRVASRSPRIIKYEVPLLELPAFMDAASPSLSGSQVLLQPVTVLAFSECLGAQYWKPDAMGWPAMVNESASANTWRSPLVRGPALRDEIEADARQRRAEEAIPEMRPKKRKKPQTAEKDSGPFSESAQHPTSFSQEDRTGLLGSGVLNSPGGITSGLFLLALLFALLVSQLRGFEKGQRRRRSAARRAPSRRRR